MLSLPEPFIILPPIVALPEIVTLFGRPIVSVCPLADVSISFVVPAIVKDSLSNQLKSSSITSNI